MIKISEWRDAPYRDILAMQRSIFAGMVEKKRAGLKAGDGEILFVEHRPVYTLGRHGNSANIINRSFIESHGAEIVEIERGGDITFHGPGQLVAYPIIDFGERGLGVKKYVSLLEEAVIMTIGDFGIKGRRIDGATGVWIKNGHSTAKKICAIGIKCSRFISMHGLALNVDTDLSWFSAINPCGFTDRGVTSISKETGRKITFEEAASSLRRHLLHLLAY